MRLTNSSIYVLFRRELDLNEYSAATIEEAIKAAEKDLHQSRERLKVSVIQQPRHGFLGIGRRAAKIQVEVKKVAKPQPKTVNHQAANQPQNQHREKKPSGQSQANKQSTSNHQRSRSHEKPRRSHRQSQRSRQNHEISPEEMNRRHQANVAKTKAAATKLVDYLHQILAAMSIDGSVELTTVKAHEVEVNIKTDQSGRVIGHHGRRINALESLAGAFMDYHGADNVFVTVDTANYRERRQKALKRVAENAVVDVISTGQAVFLDPMPARERKQLHKELEHNDHVITYSNGKEPHRSVVIAPKN